MLQHTADQLNRTFASLFIRPGVSRTGRWWRAAWLVFLFAAGAFLWYRFFPPSEMRFNYQDWYLVTGPRFYFLKDALTHLALPFHISSTLGLGGFTDRYMSIPDAFLAPQTVLLFLLTVPRFIVIDQVLMYALGFAGLLWFRKKFSLSIFAFTILVILFNFNGHVLSHYSVGHFTWGGYFLFPAFVMLVIGLLEGERNWMWVAKMAGLLFFMWLNGSFHQFVWSLLFLILLGVTCWRTAIPAAKAVVFSLLLGLVRIFPIAMLMGTYNSSVQFLGGFPNLTTLLAGLTTIQPPSTEVPLPFLKNSMGWWELSLFIGVIGTLFLVYFGMVRWLQNHALRGAHHELILPVLALIIFSVGDTFLILKAIPLFAGERATARVISLPFTVLLMMAALELQRWLDERHLPNWAYPGLVLVAGLEGIDLYQYFRTWEIGRAFSAFPLHEFLPGNYTVANHADPAYFQALTWGAAASALSLIILGLVVWLERRGVLEKLAQKALNGAGRDASSAGPLRTMLIRALVPADAGDFHRAVRENEPG
jgi:ABC-type amino acid transport system permease subunit